MTQSDLRLRLIDIPTSSEEKGLHNIYEISFPPEERRPWQKMFDGEKSADRPEFFAIEIYDAEGRTWIIAGLITIWDLDGVKYIEHFAVSPAMRSSGIGKRVLSMICGEILLEVEPPETSSEAERRIRFYQRTGFELSDVEYIQPPYSHGMPAIPLRLMTRGVIADIRHTISLLKSRVYGCDDKQE